MKFDITPNCEILYLKYFPMMNRINMPSIQLFSTQEKFCETQVRIFNRQTFEKLMKLLVICYLVIGSMAFKQKLFRRFHKTSIQNDSKAKMKNRPNLQDFVDGMETTGEYARPEFKTISYERKQYLARLMKTLYKTGRNSEQLLRIYENNLF